MVDTQRWRTLCKKGWVFESPQRIPGTIGIRMRKGRNVGEFHVDANLTVDQIHERLLMLCEMYDIQSECFS